MGSPKAATRSCTAAIDNAVAMAEVAKADIAVVIGGDNGWNQLIVQPEIRSLADSARQDRDRRCAEHRLRAAALRDAGAEGSEEGRLRGEAGRRDVPPAGGDPRRQDHRGLDAQSAVLGAGREGRAEEPGFGREGDRAVSGDRRLRDARVGEAERGHAGQISAGLCGGRALVARSGEQGRGDGAADGPAEARRGRRRAGLCGRDRSGRASPRTARSTSRACEMCSSCARPSRTWGGTPPAPEKYLDLSYYQKAFAGLCPGVAVRSASKGSMACRSRRSTSAMPGTSDTARAPASPA